MLLAMDPSGGTVELPGEDTNEPTFGLRARWIRETDRDEAQFRGYTVVDPATVITTHLTEIIRDNMADLLSSADTQKLLDELPKEHQKLVGAVIPAQISVVARQRSLQNLHHDSRSLRPLP